MTLDRESCFCVEFDNADCGLIFTSSTHATHFLCVSRIKEIFERYFALNQKTRDQSSSFNTSKWPDAPSMTISPWFAAVIRFYLANPNCRKN